MDSPPQDSLSEGKPVADHIEASPQKTEKIDTTRTDEAMKVLAHYTGEQSWEPSEEKRLVRKIDWRLLPVLCMTYGLQYYDKAMLSQAAIFGLRQDLGLIVGNRYSMSAAIFYLGFIVGAYPTMFLAQRYPIHHVASGIVTLWGICLILTSVCHNYQSLYAQRFFLGLLESGISPMFMMIVGGWYKKNEQALRMGIWYSCTGYVSIFSPLINYGLGHIKGSLSSWKYMYLFAGALTIFWGVCLEFLLPSDPVSARGFNERERYISVARMRTNNSGVRNTHFKMGQVVELALDIKFWLIFFTAFLAMIANAPVSTFTPIIINSFGFSTLESLLLVIPAGFYGGTMMLILPWLGYKYTSKGIRSWLVIGGQIVTTVACLLLLLLPLNETGGLLFACYILPTMGAGYAVLMGLQIGNIAGYTKRSLSSSGLYIGYCLGNFVGPLCFREQDSPRYVPGFIVTVVTSVIAAVLVFVYRFVCLYDNRRRDATGVLEGFENAYQDDLTDKTVRHPTGGLLEAPSRSDAAEFGAPSTSPATALHWMGWAYRNASTLMSQVLWLMGNFQKAPGGLKIVKAFGICTTVLPFTIDTQARFGDELEERFGSWSRHLFSLVSAFNCFFLTMLAILLLLVGTIQVHAGWVLILHYIIFSVVVTVISFGARLPRDQPTGVNTVKDIMKGIAMGCYMSTALVIPALIVFLQEPDSPGSDVITYIRCEPLALWRNFIAIFP
ncbi:major facilitator superfamily domain-containing protein [Aspergillus flavus]|uniref:Major facilitator superfamily domain-containing protein n=1 Tax=Aspergillus flavus TaxID=5059 RepID=A0A5N6GLP5_ASPFL|nr:major facilitator superfamily domain-containing protein [Aspergillus flavus]